jgi:hypothetical protein
MLPPSQEGDHNDNDANYHDATNGPTHNETCL